MGAAQFDDRPACAFVDVHDVDANVVAAAQMLSGDLLIAREERFVLVVQHHGDGAGGVVGAAHLGVDDLADAMREVLEHGIAFGLADALQDDLLGGLRRNAAKVSGLGRHAHHIAQFGIGDKAFRFFERDFGALVEHLFHYFALGENAHFAGHAINFRRDIGDRAVVAFVGRDQRRFNCLKDDLAIQTFVGRHLIDACNQSFRHIYPLQQQKWGQTHFRRTPLS